MKPYIKLVALSILTLGSSLVGLAAESKFEPTLESLKQHKPAPEWLQDAKLGIYFHWGPYSSAAFWCEWYGRGIFQKGSKEYEHHLKMFGDPLVVGYEATIPLLTGEKFDADEWADLFQKSGARFAGPVAIHHDAFAMWDSEVTPWNAKDMGPKRDVVGEMLAALKKRNMKTITTFHHERSLQRYTANWDKEEKFANTHFPYNPAWPTSATDDRRWLYGNVPEQEWLETFWLGTIKEVVNKYQPDMIWFDSWLDEIPENYRFKMSAYYLNAAAQWGKEVAIIRKQEDLPIEFSVLDHEKSRETEAAKALWMTDDTVSAGSWSYVEDLEIKPYSSIIHSLVDTVSKNGVLFLNISPKADGTIPDDQRAVLAKLGEWLRQNGEAIYSTRPWKKAAEGPAQFPARGEKIPKRDLWRRVNYTASDVRYTMSKDGQTVYAILMGSPTTPSVRLQCVNQADGIKKITTIDGREVKWSADASGVTLEPTDIKPGEAAVVFKIGLK